MARARMIKPEFWTSEQVTECGIASRLLFIGILNFSDDQGVHPDSPKQLKMKVFPGDDMTVETITDWLQELVENGLLMRFTVDGRDYLHVTGWERHQRIRRPTFSYPSPAHVPEDSRTCTAHVPHTSRRSEVKRSEEKRREVSSSSRGKVDTKGAASGLVSQFVTHLLDLEFNEKQVKAFVPTLNGWAQRGLTLDKLKILTAELKRRGKNGVAPQYLEGAVDDLLSGKYKPDWAKIPDKEGPALMKWAIDHGYPGAKTESEYEYKQKLRRLAETRLVQEGYR